MIGKRRVKSFTFHLVTIFCYVVEVSIIARCWWFYHILFKLFFLFSCNFIFIFLKCYFRVFLLVNLKQHMMYVISNSCNQKYKKVFLSFMDGPMSRFCYSNFQGTIIQETMLCLDMKDKNFHAIFLEWKLHLPSKKHCFNPKARQKSFWPFILNWSLLHLIFNYSSDVCDVVWGFN